MKQLQQNGFTLIELMVTVAIIGILAGIAYPGYQDSVMKSRRADAKGALLGLANAMERHFTVKNTYLGAGTTDGNTGSPTIFSTTSPVDGGTPYYNLTIDDTVTASSYTLKAEPIGAQAKDKCGTLSLTQTGARGVSTALAVTDCW
jgi:type IV pilus assembly protein PilE